MNIKIVIYLFCVVCNTIVLSAYGQRLQNINFGAGLQTRYHSNFAELVFKPTALWSASFSIGKATNESDHFDLGNIEIDGQFWGFGVSATILQKKESFPTGKRILDQLL